jgi:hypothetical protein
MLSYVKKLHVLQVVCYLIEDAINYLKNMITISILNEVFDNATKFPLFFEKNNKIMGISLVFFNLLLFSTKYVNVNRILFPFVEKSLFLIIISSFSQKKRRNELN